MNSIEKTLGTLRNIDSICTKTIRRFVTFVKDIEDEELDVKENLKETFPSKTEEDIDSAIQDVCMALISDAETVKKELKEFSRYISRDVETLEEVTAPFLTEVWSGDVYDSSRFDALKLLLQDLQKNHDNICEEYVQKTVVEQLS